MHSHITSEKLSCAVFACFTLRCECEIMIAVLRQIVRCRRVTCQLLVSTAIVRDTQGVRDAVNYRGESISLSHVGPA